MPSSEQSDSVFLRGLDRRIVIEWRWFTLALVALTVVLVFWGDHFGLQKPNYLIYDFALTTSRHHAPSNDIVIITIDDESLAESGYWPWRRATHAHLLSRLGNARAVGLDVLLTDSNPAYPEDDEILADAIARHGRVVLAEYIDQPLDKVTPPLAPFAEAAAAVGFINAQIDADGLIRSVLPAQVYSGGTAHHFSDALADIGSRAAAQVPGKNEAPANRLIAYAGPAGSYTMVPYYAVLNGAVPESVFEDKYVLIGAWAAGLGDVFPVPASQGGEPMAGVEILANVLQGEIENRWVHILPQGWLAVLAILPVIVVCVGLRHLSPRQAFFGTTFVALGILLCCWLAMRLLDYWVAPMASLAGVMLAYPLWSWRSQEAALRHIDDELHKLNTDKLMAGQLLESEEGSLQNRSLPARIQALYQGVGLLRRSVRQREETLHFLSHDMRSPQSAILALTKLRRAANLQQPDSEAELLDRIDRYARTTLGLVDSFVQFARAESASFNFRQLNLIDLLFDVCDTRWPQAQSRQMRIAFDPEVQEAWVHADELMLARVFGNLLDNAINYSDAGTRIVCTIERRGPCWCVSIVDEGRGIAADEIAYVFQPFRRVGTSRQASPQGSGLGLAYVQTVVARHRGTVAVSSVLGAGSTFTVCLPAITDNGPTESAQESFDNDQHTN